MKLSIKNLKGEVFTVEVEPTDTITSLKGKIFEAKGLSVQSQKIVYKGKTVNNDDQIQKLGIKETDFLVVMSQVPKPQPKGKVEQKPETKTEEKPASKQETKVEKSAGSTNPVPPSQPSNEAQINELMSMGFPRDKCVQALRAAFNNTDRAVQYLINGIPANLGRHPPPGHQSQNAPSGAAALASIVNHPQFAQIRQMIRTNPASLQPILQSIASSSPQLYEIISRYPEQFERLIMDEGEEGAEGSFQPPPPPPGTILISQAQQQAINRLRQLGFSKMEAAQAYFACDKNEELAANLLFDRLANGDIQMQPQQPQGGTGSQGGSGNTGNQGGNTGSQGGNTGNQGGNTGSQGGSGSTGKKEQNPPKKEDDDDDNLFN